MSKKISNTHEKWLEKIFTVHGNRYEYPEQYILAHTKINIKCKIHGLFLCSPHNHKQGKGCPSCARLNIKGGWSYSTWEDNAKKSKYCVEFKVYVIHCFNETEEFIKIRKNFYRTIC